MKLTKPLLASSGALDSSVGTWQAYEGGNPSNHGVLLSEGYQWSLPTSKYDHPMNRQDNGNAMGFRTNGCFEHFFNSEVKFDTQREPKAKSADASDDFTGDSLLGNVEGCFLGDFKYRDKTKQKAISLKTELALRKGNHGLAVWSVLTSMKTNDTAPEEHTRLVRLQKTGSTWGIKKGYFLATSTSSTGKYPQLKIWKQGKEIFGWGARADFCRSPSSTTSSGEASVCEDWDDKETRHLKWFEIFESDKEGAEKIFGNLVVEDPSQSEQEYKYAFWIPKDKNWSDALGWKNVNTIYDNGNNVWKNLDVSYFDVKQYLEKWLKPFKDEKGTWYDGNEWCRRQSNIRDGSPSDLFRELCYRKTT